MKLIISLLCSAMLTTAPAARAGDISSVLAEPIFGQPYSCTEHWEGNLKGLGDELGTDCWIQELAEVHGRTWMRSYIGKGERNQDWYGWHKEVLSPCTCEVVKINENPTTNRPGVFGKPPASFIALKRDDGVFFLLAHAVEIQVKPADKVQSGQVIARVGNNGYSRQPHIHIGAWKGSEPLQVKFNQAAMGKLFER